MEVLRIWRSGAPEKCARSGRRKMYRWRAKSTAQMSRPASWRPRRPSSPAAVLPGQPAAERSLVPADHLLDALAQCHARRIGTGEGAQARRVRGLTRCAIGTRAIKHDRWTTARDVAHQRHQFSHAGRVLVPDVDRVVGLALDHTGDDFGRIRAMPV